MLSPLPPLRLALLMHSLNPRGGVVHALELAEALQTQGHQVTLIAAGMPGQRLFRPTRAQVSVAPVGVLPTSLVPAVRARIDAVAAHLRTLDLSAFDVLHSQDSITANALADLKDEGRIEGFMRTVHHLDTFDDERLTRWQARGVLQADRLLCVSALWRDVLARDWQRQARRVDNGVNLQRFQPVTDAAQADNDVLVRARWGLAAGQPYWLAVGGIEARKNTARLLAGFARVMHEHPSSRLVIVGGASLLDHAQARAEFEAVRRAAGLGADQTQGHRLVLTGPVPDHDLPPLYRGATALAMPSLKEGFGLVAIEAMACGTPAIVSRIAPFTEHLQPPEAFWVDPLDVDDLAEALRLSLDPQQRRRRAEPARAVAARFDWHESARQHLAVYREPTAPLMPLEPGALCHA